jgi:hypothetical protein
MNLKLRFQGEQIEKLIKTVKTKSEQLNYLMSNKKIREHFQIVKGETLCYLNSKNEKQETKINHVNDLFNIMIDMLNIKK